MRRAGFSTSLLLPDEKKLLPAAQIVYERGEPDELHDLEAVGNSRKLNDPPTVSTTLGNPARKAGFPHSHRANDGFQLSTTKNFTPPKE